MVDLQESEDEKPAPKAKQDTKSAKKDSSSDKSGSDESESEDEEETPKKKVCNASCLLFDCILLLLVFC